MRVDLTPASTLPFSFTLGAGVPTNNFTLGLSGELAVLAAQLESGHVDNESNRDAIRAAGAKILIDNEAKLKQLLKAIKAAESKGLWQKVLTAFKIIGALAVACTGNPVAITAAALIIVGVALEKTNPKAAMGLELSGAALMVANAAGSLAGAAAMPAGATTTSFGVSSAVPQYATAGSLGGMGVATIKVGHLGAVELHADAARIRAEHRIEDSKKEIDDAISRFKANAETVGRVRAAIQDLLEANHEGTRALRA